MNSRIPTDAFTFYVSLGPERSYQAVAEKFGVSKRAVTKCAKREDWQGRLASIEAKSRERSDEKLAETLEEMSDRHLRMLKVMQRKALEALSSMPLTSAMDGVRALSTAIQQERLVRGEPSQRSEVSVEEISRREVERLLTLAPDDEDGDEDGDEGDADDEDEAA